MSNLGPLTLIFTDGRDLNVSSLRDVVKALSGWPENTDDPELATLQQLAEEAIGGCIAPRVAFDAFALKAYRCGIVKPKARSRAWEDFAAPFRRETLR